MQTTVHRNYTNAAVIVFVLYWFAFVPGLVANIIYWQDACAAEDQTGIHLRGVGCLGAMLSGGIALSIALAMGLTFVVVGGRF